MSGNFPFNSNHCNYCRCHWRIPVWYFCQTKPKDYSVSVWIVSSNSITLQLWVWIKAVNSHWRMSKGVNFITEELQFYVTSDSKTKCFGIWLIWRYTENLLLVKISYFHVRNIKKKDRIIAGFERYPVLFPQKTKMETHSVEFLLPVLVSDHEKEGTWLVNRFKYFLGFFSFSSHSNCCYWSHQRVKVWFPRENLTTNVQTFLSSLCVTVWWGRNLAPISCIHCSQLAACQGDSEEKLLHNQTVVQSKCNVKCDI